MRPRREEKQAHARGEQPCGWQGGREGMGRTGSLGLVGVNSDLEMNEP